MPLIVLELVIRWMIRRTPGASVSHGIKLVAESNANQVMHYERLRAALGAVWRWNLEALAAELLGWAVDARLRRAGFGAKPYRERREHRVLLERITVGGVLLAMEESAAELRAQAKRERESECRGQG